MLLPYRIIVLVFGFLAIPLIPIIGIYRGATAPEFIIKGTLNLSSAQAYVRPDPFEFYIDYLLQIAVGNFGTSTATGVPVFNLVLSSFAFSFLIVFISLIIAIFMSLIMTALKFSLGGRWINFLMLTVSAVPLPAAIYVLGYMSSFAENQNIFGNEIILASIALCLYPTYLIFSALSTSVDRFMNSTPTLFSLSCGLPRWHIWTRYGIRDAIVAVLGVLETAIIYMLAFIFFVEAPFSLPGVGLRFVNAIQRFDIPVICGVTFFALIFFALISICIELSIKVLAKEGH